MKGMNDYKAILGRDPREDPWSERFGFFWYNDREIFTFSDEDFDRSARGFSEAGINHVITFSCTHFRWSFRPWWDLIHSVLARAVEAFHRYGIAVTEHHSSHLTFNPLDDEDVRFMERVLRKRKSTLSSWPGIREYNDEDPLIDGARLSSFRQIDGRTGKFARTNYHGYGMCFNSPAYRRAYLEYLDTVYATGIDGIMTDDVQYFALESWQQPGHACACEHCRRLFLEDTGFDLPDPGEQWSDWYGDYESESFLAWIDFRLRSTGRFHQAVADHYEKQNLRLLRPNYVSTALSTNPTAYALDTLPRLDWVFQENCFAHVIRYSWPSWAVDAAHRTMLGTRRNIPVMSMFYPDRDDSRMFSWSLAKSWGHMYLGTDEGDDDPRREAPLRNFEKAHRRAFAGPTRISDVAMYDSRQNRMKKADASRTTIPQLFTWAQSCYFASVPFILIQSEDLAEDSVGAGKLTIPPVIVINDLSIFDEKDAAWFTDYVDSGGTIIETENHHSQWGAIAAPDVGDAQLGVVSVDRWPGEHGRSDASPVDSCVWEVQTRIVEFLKTHIGDRWSCRFEGLPAGILGTAFIAPELPGIAVHLVDTRGCLEVDPKVGISHEDPIPDLGTVDLARAHVSLRIDRIPSLEGTIRSARAFGLDSGEVTLEAQSGDRGAEFIVPLGEIKLSRYALIEVVVTG